MEYDFVRAIALVMIIEGVMPFLNPGGFKRNMLRLLQVPNVNLRVCGLLLMLAGLGVLYGSRA